MAWTTPKLDWQASDAPTPADWNRAEGNSQQLKTDTDAHAANTTTAHGATSAATANKIPIRDANGRFKVAAPSANDDVAQKAQVDAVQTNLGGHIDTDASTSGKGHVQLATKFDVTGGSSNTLAVTPQALKEGHINSLSSTLNPGHVELATPAEVRAGDDLDRAVTPYTLKDALNYHHMLPIDTGITNKTLSTSHTLLTDDFSAFDGKWVEVQIKHQYIMGGGIETTRDYFYSYKIKIQKSEDEHEFESRGCIDIPSRLSHPDRATIIFLSDENALNARLLNSLTDETFTITNMYYFN